MKYIIEEKELIDLLANSMELEQLEASGVDRDYEYDYKDIAKERLKNYKDNAKERFKHFIEYNELILEPFNEDNLK